MSSSGSVRTVQERLDEFYHRLANSPLADSAQGALDQLGATLNEVEDLFSGIPRKDPPPPPTMPDGRMYPPLPDNIIRHVDGAITAKTRGHIIEIGVDGTLIITSKRTGLVEFSKKGKS